MEHISIDAGHGGDPKAPGLSEYRKRRILGAVSGDFVEAEYTINLARHFAGVVRHSCEPYVSHLTRGRNHEEVTLAERGRRSAEFGADLVVSLHVNAHVSQVLRGALVFYWPRDDIGREVADSIARAMPPPLRRERSAIWAATDNPTADDDWLQRPRNVLDPHIEHATAVLVEVGYISNPTDRHALEDSATQSAIVAALMVGAARYRQIRKAAQ